MGGCQNYGPLLGSLNIGCHIMLRTQKGTIILTTTQMVSGSRRVLGLRTRLEGPRGPDLRRRWLGLGLQGFWLGLCRGPCHCCIASFVMSLCICICVCTYTYIYTHDNMDMNMKTNRNLKHANAPGFLSCGFRVEATSQSPNGGVQK